MEHARPAENDILTTLTQNYVFELPSVREKLRIAVTEGTTAATPTTLDKMEIQRLGQERRHDEARRQH